MVGKTWRLTSGAYFAIGNITLDVDIGDNQVTSHTFGVLHDNNKTRTFGRDLLKKLKMPTNTSAVNHVID